MAWGPIWPWGFKPTEIIKVVDYGDLSFDYAKPVTIVKAIEKQISQILSDGTSTLVLGGDHYISYPVLKAYSEFYQDFYVLQFDAHPDLWESGGNDRLDHGIFMYNLIKKNIVNPKKLIQVGIRTFIEDGLGSNVLDMEWINQNGIEKVVSEIKSIVGNNPVYLTFDMDCLDPSCAPGTGTPVVGGLSSFQALSILRKLKGINFIGMDIVEVCPPYDIADITALAAATVSLEYLSLRASHFQV